MARHLQLLYGWIHSDLDPDPQHWFYVMKGLITSFNKHQNGNKKPVCERERERERESEAILRPLKGIVQILISCVSKHQKM